jgi:hypothetical protein
MANLGYRTSVVVAVSEVKGEVPHNILLNLTLVRFPPLLPLRRRRQAQVNRALGYKH